MTHCALPPTRLGGAGVAWLILEGHNGAALGALAVAGASDWADGYVAKRWGQASVVGSYLDPAADKVLVGCTVAALAWQARHPRACKSTVSYNRRLPFLG